MTTRKKLSFGIKTPQHRTTYEAMLRVWQEAIVSHPLSMPGCLTT